MSDPDAGNPCEDFCGFKGYLKRSWKGDRDSPCCGVTGACKFGPGCAGLILLAVMFVAAVLAVLFAFFAGFGVSGFSGHRQLVASAVTVRLVSSGQGVVTMGAKTGPTMQLEGGKVQVHGQSMGLQSVNPNHIVYAVDLLVRPIYGFLATSIDVNGNPDGDWDVVWTNPGCGTTSWDSCTQAQATWLNMSDTSYNIRTAWNETYQNYTRVRANLPWKYFVFKMCTSADTGNTTAYRGANMTTAWYFREPKCTYPSAPIASPVGMIPDNPYAVGVTFSVAGTVRSFLTDPSDYTSTNKNADGWYHNFTRPVLTPTINKCTGGSAGDPVPCVKDLL